MNAAEAKAVAEFLGEPYRTAEGRSVVYVQWDMQPPSDADLLLACLERGKELNLYPCLGMTLGQTDWVATLVFEGGTFYRGPTPLAAIVSAICAYQEQKR